MKYEFGNTDTAVFCNTDTEYRTDFKKYRLPKPTQNTDTDSALVLTLYVFREQLFFGADLKELLWCTSYQMIDSCFGENGIKNLVSTHRYTF